MTCPAAVSAQNFKINFFFLLGHFVDSSSVDGVNKKMQGGTVGGLQLVFYV